MIFDADKNESRLQSLKIDPRYTDVDKYIEISQYSNMRETNPNNIYNTTQPLKRSDKNNSNVPNETACFGGPLKIDNKSQIDDVSFDHLRNASFLS